MSRKWKITIIVWTGIILFFGIGSVYAQDADLLLIIFYSLLLLAASIYTVAIWVGDRAKGEPERAYHLSAYPRSVLRFMFDDTRDEEKQPKKT